MPKQIGVRYSGVPTIGELLYFDEIVVVAKPLSASEFAAAIEWFKAKGVHGDLPVYLEKHSPIDLATLDRLIEKGVVVDISKFLTRPESVASYKLAAYDEDDFALQIMKILYDPTTKNEGLENTRVSKADHADIVHRVEERMILPHRRAIESWPDCTPTTIYFDASYQTTDYAKGQVLEVILKAIPTPDADTPIEAVLDFRANPDAMISLRRLRRWMSKIATKNMSASEIEDELVELIDNYTEYMNVHRMKYTNSTLHTLVSVSLDVLDNLTRLRFKSVFDSLFALHTQRIALTEAELNAPGREAAYIVHAQQAFQAAK